MLVVPLHAAQFDESAVHIARECSGAIFMQPRCELKLIRRLIACYRTICLRSRIRIIPHLMHLSEQEESARLYLAVSNDVEAFSQHRCRGIPFRLSHKKIGVRQHYWPTPASGEVLGVE